MIRARLVISHGVLAVDEARVEFAGQRTGATGAFIRAEAFETSRQVVKLQLAFYSSTPAYAPVLALHGWEDLQPLLHRLSKQGEWQKMGELIDDEFLETFANPGQIAPRFAQRYGGLIDTWQCTLDLGDREAQSQLLRSLQRL